MRKARETPGLTLAERIVLETLTDYAHPERGVYLSRGELVRRTGVHTKTIQTALRRLIALGYVGELGRAQPGRVRTLMPYPDRWPTLAPDEGGDPGPDEGDPGPDRDRVGASR